MFTYHSWAEKISEGQILSESSFYMDPLYPYLMALIYKIFGINIFIIQLIQYLIGILTALLLFKILKLFITKKILKRLKNT